jgi:hypothetical protein
MTFAGMKTLLRSLSLSVALVAAIAPRLALAKWPIEGMVGRIQLGDGGTVGVVLETNPALCSNAEHPTWGEIAASAPGKKEMLAALMMAKAAGLKVALYTVDPAPAGAKLCQIQFVDLVPSVP